MTILVHFKIHNQSTLLHCIMNGLIENLVQEKKNVVFPPVMVGSSPKWLTQHGPLICMDLESSQSLQEDKIMD